MAKFELKPVNELPKRRLRREPMYDEIISNTDIIDLSENRRMI